ncbi:XRE family transcriptional regulator [Streptomyces sp. NPDC090106]|uniref:XRE family transcriptional regulator n=1 Tax=Streptomyces sp. NPDC090106 TaxID=3365946 RepID=UPI0037F88A0F
MAHTTRQLPPRPPFPPAAAVGGRGRVAWLLRVNRVLGARGSDVSLPAFADAFAGGSYGRPVSVSALSRWETGQVPVPAAAVSRYEELLGLPRDLLLTTARTTLRYLATSALTRPPLSRAGKGAEAAADRAQELMEQALSRDLMRGEDWTGLTETLCEIDRFALLPASVWTQLTERLVAEMVIADDVPWMARFEALNRLLNHPRGARHAIAVCASLARDGSNYAATEVICALDNTAHPDATSRVLAELGRPSGQRALEGAVMASIRKVGYRHFTPPQLRQLAHAVREIGPEWDLFGQVQALSNVLYELPGAVPAERNRPGPYPASVRDPRAEPTVPGRLRAAPSGLLPHLPPTELAGVARRVLRHARRAKGPDRTDATLSLLVTEMFCHPVFDVRLHTSLLLAATPYRAPLADAAVAELSHPRIAATVSCALPVLGALRIIGDVAHRPSVERLALASGLPRATVSAAVHSLGHIDADPGDDAFFTQALTHYARQWGNRRDPAAATTLSGLVYAMGRAGRTDLLRDVRDHAEHPLTARQTAAWWLNLSARTRASSLT